MHNPNYSEVKDTLRKACGIFLLAAGGLIAGIAILSKQDEAQLSTWPRFLVPPANWILDNNWWIVLSLTVLAATAKFVKERLDRTWVWSAVQTIVDKIATEAFGHLNSGDVHHHRATLFQYRNYFWFPFPPRSKIWPWGRRRWPCSGWLVPVIRSGHTTRRTNTYFLAPDDADNAEGFAGKIWASNRELALSAATTLQRGANEETVTKYAEQTFVSKTWTNQQLSNNKVLAVSFRGVPIEGKAGRRWGVLILDSRDPNAAKDAKLNIQQYAYCLGRLLERV